MHTNEKLYVITCIYNPLQFKSRYTLYRAFKKYMEDSGVILITIEIAYKNRPFQVTTHYDEHNLQLRTDTLMWHKERGLNLGIQYIKENFTDAEKIAWIDADVSFSNPKWALDALYALDHYDVIQLYSEAHNLSPKHESQWKTPGIFYNYINKKGVNQEPPIAWQYLIYGHPGLAWAATMKALDCLGGLLDICIHGSADTHMASALLGGFIHYDSEHYSEGMKKRFIEWNEKSLNCIKRNVGYINGICYHFWHGKPVQRGYEKRIDIICFHKFDPDTDLIIDNQGLYKYTGNKIDMEQDLRFTLLARNEDSIDE